PHILTLSLHDALPISTFTSKLSLAHDDKVVEEITRLTEQKNYDWLITMHPLMEKDRVEKFKQLESDNVSFKDTTDLIPLYKQAEDRKSTRLNSSHVKI